MPRPFYALRNTSAFPGATVYFWCPTAQLRQNLSEYTVDPGLTLAPPTWYLAGNQTVNSYVMAVKVADAATPTC
jgi:hypothetical protein